MSGSSRGQGPVPRLDRLEGRIAVPCASCVAYEGAPAGPAGALAKLRAAVEAQTSVPHMRAEAWRRLERADAMARGEPVEEWRPPVEQPRPPCPSCGRSRDVALDAMKISGRLAAAKATRANTEDLLRADATKLFAEADRLEMAAGLDGA